MTKNKDKFKKKKGAPFLPPERVRVDLRTTVDPDTYSWLQEQTRALGRTIDKLVNDKVNKEYLDSLKDKPF